MTNTPMHRAQAAPPPVTRTLLLLVLFVPGVLLAGVLSERTPKVA